MYGLKQNHKIIQIRGSEFKIGRYHSNHVVIRTELKVSRFHAIIILHDNKPFIKDISKNEWGVFVGSQKILCERELELKVGDIITIGSEAPKDPNCILELVSIESDVPAENRENECPATQPFSAVQATAPRPIQTIDITTDDIIEIEDNVTHGRGGKHQNIRENCASPSILEDSPPPLIESTPILASRTKSVNFELPKESPIYPQNVVPNPETTPKVSKPPRSITISSDEDDDIIGVKKELGMTNTNIPTTSVNNCTPAANNIPINGLVDVTSTVNGLLRSPVVDNNSNLFEVMEPKTASTVKREFSSTENLLNVLNYSMADEVITLDSDEEDFPCSQSQFNATMVDDVPNYSDTFRGLYVCKSELENIEEEEDEDVKFICNGDSWFEPFSQTVLAEVESSKNYRKSEPVDHDIVDLPEDEPMGVCEEENDAVESSTKEYAESPSNEFAESPSKESVESPSNEFVNPKFPKFPKIKSPKVPIIEPRPHKRSKRKSTELESFPKKSSKKDGSESPDSIYKRMKSMEYSHHRTPTKTGRSSLDKSLAPSLKQQRKEKLKKITERQQSESNSTKASSSKDIEAKPKVKVTDKNRGHFLTESPTETTRKSKKDKKHHKAKPEETGTSPKVPPSRKPESNENKVPSIPKESSAIHDEQNKSNSLAKHIENLNSIKTTFKEINGSSKLTENSTTYKDDQFNNITFDRLKYQAPKLPDKISLKHIHLKPQTSLTSIQSSQNKIVKSILKIKPSSYIKSNDQTPAIPKIVKFLDRNFEKEIECRGDPRETFYAPYKKYEPLIREGQLEFDVALARVCGWSVNWLQEQQIQSVPPPLYNSPFPNGQYPSLIDKYKDAVRLTLFSSLWKGIFSVWNVPGSDVLPYSQVIKEQDILNIEKVDTTSKSDKNSSQPLLWTIFAKRELAIPNCPVDVQNGQLTILNFHVKRHTMQPSTRTMVFAYVASSNRIKEGGSVFDKIIFKVCPKPFTIELGTAKMKILTYSKTRLRQFHALAMMPNSPIVEAICDPYFHDTFEKDNIPNPNRELSDLFLDASQRKAVASCVSCVTSKKPSVYVIQGSKGTGKSQVIVSFLKELYSTEVRSTLPKKFKILIVTNCDNDADDLLHRIDSMNKRNGNPMNILRCGGNCESMHHVVRESTLHEKTKGEIARNNNLVDINEEINNLRAKINSSELVINSKNAPAAKKIEAEKKIKAYKDELEEMTREDSKLINNLKYQVAKENIIANADVIITALSSCWSSNFEMHFIPTGANRGDVHKFDVCIFDDANLFEDTALLVPLMLHVPHFILTGDEFIKAYQNSPFEKLRYSFSHHNKDFFINLDTQHRMNPDVELWVKEFYKLNTLKKPSSYKTPCSLKPFLVIDHPVSLQSGITSPYEHQVSLCERILQAILQIETDDVSKIGVIVAHHEQKEYIKNAISLDIVRKVKVDVLDRYSAREHDIILLCCPVKIFAEWLYIAITRAKSSIIICGDFEDNQNVYCVVSLMENAKQRKAFIPLRTDPKQISVERIKKLIAA